MIEAKRIFARRLTGTAALRERLARLDGAIAVAHPAMIPAADRYRARLIWALRQPEFHHERLAAGLFGGNGYGPGIDACVRELIASARWPRPPTPPAADPSVRQFASEELR